MIFLDRYLNTIISVDTGMHCENYLEYHRNFGLALLATAKVLKSIFEGKDFEH